MQINLRVWRGFYDLEQLKWNAVYNGRAGAEILIHYLKKYGLAEGGKTGKLKNWPAPRLQRGSWRGHALSRPEQHPARAARKQPVS